MEKMLINIKTDKRLKEEAQKVARELGLPLGTIINSYLRDLVRERRVIFATPPVPNTRLQKLLKKIQLDISKRKNAYGPFTYEEALEYLDKL